MPEPPKPIPQPVQPKFQPTPQPTKVSLNNNPAPRKVDPPPATKVNLGASAASMPNHDVHPSAVRLGTNTAVNPRGPAVSAVDMRGGMAGMNASNTGSGPRATAVHMGSGSPNGSNLNGRDASPVRIGGLSNGVPGGTGRGPAGPTSVHLGGTGVPNNQTARHEVERSAAAPPTLVYKPQAVYTAEARAEHIEGNVQVRIRVLTNGSVQFIGITHGLGHGLDAQARQVVEGMRFKPSMDATGHPVDWTGEVIVRFQLS